MSIGYFQWTKIGCFRWTRSGCFRRTLTAVGLFMLSLSGVYHVYDLCERSPKISINLLQSDTQNQKIYLILIYQLLSFTTNEKLL